MNLQIEHESKLFFEPRKGPRVQTTDATWSEAIEQCDLNLRRDRDVIFGGTGLGRGHGNGERRGRSARIGIQRNDDRGWQRRVERACLDDDDPLSGTFAPESEPALDAKDIAPFSH